MRVAIMNMDFSLFIRFMVSLMVKNGLDALILAEVTGVTSAFETGLK